MAQLVVRNLEDEVKARLRRRANLHGRSMEEEVRDILRKAVAEAGGDPRPPVGTRLARRFADLGLDHDVSELRGEEACPATFEE